MFQIRDAMKNKMKTGKTNNSGVTLVEVMIALVVLLIVMMGLLQASLLSIEHNLRNELRDEATRIASDRITGLRSAGFDSGDLTATGGVFVDDTPAIYTRSFRNIVPNPADPASPGVFSVQKNISDVPNAAGVVNVKQVTIRVAWQYKGEALTHTLNATIKK